MSLWTNRALACTAAGVLTALGLPAAPPAAATPHPVHPPAASASRTAAPLLARLHALYRQAEQATETYDATQERLGKQRAEVARIGRRLAIQRSALHRAVNAYGVLARQEYQGVAISPFGRLLLSDDPADALTELHVLRRASNAEAALANRLRTTERQLDGLSARARATLARADALAALRRRQSDQVRARLAAVKREVSALTSAQLAAVARAEQEATDQTQRRLLAAGLLGADDGLPSAPGERAVAFAFGQLGKPYRWGAEGPRAYDCSGLTSQAWAHAGRPIPRTSQGQWRRLPHVPLNRLRPGDLVVYFPGATHVALYLGHGKVVQAPHPGGRVEVTRVAVDPVLGAVRPDI